MKIIKQKGLYSINFHLTISIKNSYKSSIENIVNNKAEKGIATYI